MIVGRVFQEFEDRKGRNVILRTPMWTDLDDLMELINTSVDEKVDIYMDEKVTRESEAEWLGKKLAKIENGQTIGLVAECDGKVVGSSEVGKKARSMSHVGGLGILVKKGYRAAGIGTKMLETLIKEVDSAGLEILVLKYFSGNDRARHVYEKVGFKETGRIPGAVRRDGLDRDLITMTLKL